MRKIVEISLLICFFPLALFAQKERTDKEIIRDKQRVNYIYNFTRYIEWENLNESSTFKIGVLGTLEQDLVVEFILKAKTVKIKNLPVKIEYFKSLKDIRSTHILYVHERQGVDISLILNEAYKNKTLVVSENYPFHSSMINFIELGDEFNFEIDQTKIEKANLLIAPEIISYSIHKVADWDKLYSLIQEEKDIVKQQKIKLEALNKDVQSQQKTISTQNKTILTKKEALKSISDSLNLKSIKMDQQNNSLNTLSRDVFIQKEEKENLKNILDQRISDLRSQDTEINRQNTILENQKVAIKNQQDKIDLQKTSIIKQFEEIQLQKLINIGFVLFLIVLLLFALFVFKSLRRKKKNELILKERNEELSALNESLDSFVYRVSHDLKAPILNIKSMLSMLKEHLNQEESPMVQKLVGHLETSSDKLENTIVDLLDLVRLERINEKKYIVNLSEIFEELIQEYEKVITDINASIKADFSECNQILATESEVRSIFQNLLTNSLKYRAKNRLLIIKIETKKHKDVCELLFEDNGIGINLDLHKNKLFKMFQRFNVDNSIKGTGVGMYIINKLVKNCNGSIQIDGAIDKGLKYVLTFPLIKNKLI